MGSEPVDFAPITVTGATGRQGGAVVDTLLEQRRMVRAVTRNPHGDKACAPASRLAASRTCRRG
ncbi:NmrA family NAD(P)-binding protein [Mycobacterium paraense]|uniref:NmrA family NAD(P)-binding protein n=1 Tax=Mycobacterium paraense TaxID=767916 RepID=UPI000A1646A2|nr:NmrA family NAD(P)-binding protein [Mycobacterium paraense]